MGTGEGSGNHLLETNDGCLPDLLSLLVFSPARMQQIVRYLKVIVVFYNSTYGVIGSCFPWGYRRIFLREDLQEFWSFPFYETGMVPLTI